MLDQEEKKLRCEIKFSRNARAEEIMTDVEDGIVRNVSLRYVPHKIVMEREEEGTTYYRVTDWEPIHVAFVPDPADPTVGVNRNENYKSEPIIINVNNKQEKQMDPVVNTPGERTLSDTELEALTNKIKSDLKEDQQAAVDRAKTQGGEKAIQNIAAIMRMAKAFKEDLKDIVDLDKEAAKFAFELGATERQFSDFIISQKSMQKNAGTFDVPKKDRDKFNVSKLILSIADPRVNADHEREICRAYEKEKGITPHGVVIPRELLDRTHTVASSTGGGNLVGTNLIASEFIPLNRNISLADKLGVRTLPNLTGDVAIPTQTGAIVGGWMTDESTGAAAADASFGQKTLSPQTFHGLTGFSRKLLLQSTPAINMLVEDDLQKIANLAKDRAIFHGRGHATYGEPQGIHGTSGVGLNTIKTSFSFADMVLMETTVAAANLEVATSAYVITPTIRGALKTTLKDSGVGGYIWENNEVNGYRAFASNQITAGFVFFGDFSQVVVGEWGGLDIVVDAVSSDVGIIKVKCFLSMDVALRYAGAFANYRPI